MPAGGPGRAADVATVTLQARGIVRIEADGRVADSGTQALGDPIAGAVVEALRRHGGVASLVEVRVAAAQSPSVLAVESGSSA
ncbi:hypothetical protein ACIBSV_48380 [Embleya sp. NPDC050154]|uniref:hypothetical protein n=1 Tax=Embleya sp. NPDC050154 TaxID=3363988 RepID=UPI0037B02CA8